MAKVSWGITATEIDSAETGGFAPYDGPVPKPGVYGVKPKLKMDESSNGNQMIRVVGIIDGSMGRDKEAFDGCPLFDQVVVMDKTAWKVKQLTDALGITGKDMVTNTVIDKSDKVVSMGTFKFTENARIMVQVKRGKDQDGEPRAEIGNYLAASGATPAKAADPEPDPDPEEPEEATGGTEEAAEDWTYEELAAMDLDELKEVIEVEELDIKVLKSHKAEAVLAKVLEALGIEEEPADEAPAEEPEAEPAEGSEEWEEIQALTRVGMRKFIKENGLDVKVLTKFTDDELRAQIAEELGIEVAPF